MVKRLNKIGFILGVFFVLNGCKLCFLKLGFTKGVYRRYKEYYQFDQALLDQAQGLLNFLVDNQLTQEMGIEMKKQVDEDGYLVLNRNVVQDAAMLILGSPSPQTFIKAGKQWAKFYKETGIKVPVIISTGRGRGYKSLVLRTIEFLKRYNQDALQEFESEFKDDVEETKTDISPEELMKKKGKLTEAKVIEFLFKIGVKKSLGQADYNSLNFDQIIQLEEKSNNTRTNMLESFNLIKKVNKSKVIVITDAFHRLRALLAAVEVFNVEKGKNWQICAPALFVPELRVGKDFGSFSTLEELLGYLTHMAGNPLGSGEKERMGEVERIKKYFLTKSEEKLDLFDKLEKLGNLHPGDAQRFRNKISEWLSKVEEIREALKIWLIKK